MKISIVIADDVKQIMMTPENRHEREALKFIQPNDEINVAYQLGTYDNEPSHFSYNSSLCQGGHVRRFATEDSLMFVIKNKEKDNQKQ